jgi:arylsulfatase A-like enzyme
MREPTVAWWPETIPAGSVSDEIATTMDLLPTFAKLGSGKVPGDRIIDGKNISPLFHDPDNAKSPHKAFFYHRGNDLRAVRSGPWKLHANGRLYNLDKDIAESNNVAGQNPQVVARLKRYMQDFNTDLKKNSRPVGKVANPKYLVQDKAQ